MQESLGHLQRAYAVRGNCFSFLLPWDTVMKTLSRAFAEGDFSEWPLDQDTAAQIVRVTMVRGHEALLDQFKELKVRSRVVKAMANLYVDNHLAELMSRASVVKLLVARRGDLRQQFREHIELRVDAAYPANQHGDEEGSVPERMRACFAEARREALEKKTSDTAFDQKQATGHDLPSTSVEVLADLRPSIVVGERTTQDALPQEVVVQSAFNKVTGMGVQMGQDFEPQFNASYMARAYPWALNYSCGGADYPDLFGDWDNKAVQGREAVAQSDGKHSRRQHDEPCLLPGPYAQMLATRVEMQVAGDWMLVPAARNLHWRYEVLHSAFMVCKMRLAPSSDMEQHLRELLEATEYIWDRMSKNTVTVKGVTRPINGRIESLFQDDKIGSCGKLILKSYLNTTRHIAGCQAIRQKIGHILFGFRVVYGECLFVTVSPNRRHSALIFRLSRARKNDTMLRQTNATMHWRSQYCGPKQPRFMSSFAIDMDIDGVQAAAEIPLPPLLNRQAWNAQDPLASDHHYRVIMHVVIPASFGVRMCFNCPHCNVDANDPNVDAKFVGCGDLLASNSKLMGGFAGVATSLAFANENQGEGTPHGHGFVSLANMYQHNTLQEIAAMLERNARSLSCEEIVERVKTFCNHVQQESHSGLGYQKRHRNTGKNLEV